MDDQIHHRLGRAPSDVDNVANSIDRVDVGILIWNFLFGWVDEMASASCQCENSCVRYYEKLAEQSRRHCIAFID